VECCHLFSRRPFLYWPLYRTKFKLRHYRNFAREIRDRALDAYGQDTYKVTSRLTLNLGLRYELPFPSTENHNEVNLFVPGAQSKVIPNASAGLLYPGDPGVPAGLIPTQKTAFAPRVGAAWDPRGDGKTVVSAAYGMFYEPYYTGEGGCDLSTRYSPFRRSRIFD
jgi:outer membrane receptor protein involved in Fe transport